MTSGGLVLTHRFRYIITVLSGVYTVIFKSHFIDIQLTLSCYTFLPSCPESFLYPNECVVLVGGVTAVELLAAAVYRADGCRCRVVQGQR